MAVTGRHFELPLTFLEGCRFSKNALALCDAYNPPEIRLSPGKALCPSRNLRMIPARFTFFVYEYVKNTWLSLVGSNSKAER